MTIASEITRLQWAKANARTSIINKWVDVPANASVEDYHTYIDQIQQWVPQEDYDLVVSIWKWAAIGYPDKNSWTYVSWFWWDSFMCKIWNYVFMIGGYSYADRWSSWHWLFGWNVWIYYKTVWASSWSWCKASIWTLDSASSGSVYVSITPVYIESTNSINLYAQVTWNQWDSKSKYFNRVIWNNSINSSSSLAWEDLNNYKIYNSHIHVREVDARTTYWFWYIIDEPLL